MNFSSYLNFITFLMQFIQFLYKNILHSLMFGFITNSLFNVWVLEGVNELQSAKCDKTEFAEINESNVNSYNQADVVGTNKSGESIRNSKN